MSIGLWILAAIGTGLVAGFLLQCLALIFIPLYGPIFPWKKGRRP